MAGLGDFGKYATIGISWVLTTAVYLYIGYRGGLWLDARWQTEPIFMVAGILFGMVMSVMTLVKELLVLTDARPTGPTDSAGKKNGRVREKNNIPRHDDLGPRGRGREDGKSERDGPAR